ncbi:hypothetical protein CDCA_CDCA06G1785 [Cyanidium caldarium]|uniref:4-(cytidine 5'-diphospho)-2-C-methyl-D-erythritol kinase n=1 Tax=Cyanidium caldarium TaxID=2771 RepID=A0AAV9ITZ1_CYACA|nr:hypothetical protein CDCA_CDCA06G1785 [Cyanidium caldarium]
MRSISPRMVEESERPTRVATCRWMRERHVHLGERSGALGWVLGAGNVQRRALRAARTCKGHRGQASAPWAWGTAWKRRPVDRVKWRVPPGCLALRAQQQPREGEGEEEYEFVDDDDDDDDEEDKGGEEDEEEYEEAEDDDEEEEYEEAEDGGDDDDEEEEEEEEEEQAEKQATRRGPDFHSEYQDQDWSKVVKARLAALRGERSLFPSTSTRTVKAGASTWEEEPLTRVEYYSPAKINVFLRVLRRRMDGFHDIASVFQAVTLADKLYIEKLPDGADDDVLECDSPQVPLDKSNLIIKALETFRVRTGLSTRFHVRLEKTIPMQAGLGGGSSNAATAMFAANRLCGRPATIRQLTEWASEVGSDTAFFMSRGTAHCTGRGEILKRMRPLGPTGLYIIKPRAHSLSTPQVYQALDLNQLTGKTPPDELLRSIQERGPFLTPLVNDLEEAAFRLVPGLRDFKQLIESYGFKRVLMSGSGTSFFALGYPYGPDATQFEKNFLADVAQNDLGGFLSEGVEVYPCRFVHRFTEERWYMEPLPPEWLTADAADIPETFEY